MMHADFYWVGKEEYLSTVQMTILFFQSQIACTKTPSQYFQVIQIAGTYTCCGLKQLIIKHLKHLKNTQRFLTITV